MKTFLQYISEAHKGPKPRSATHYDDVDYIKSELNYFDVRNMSNKINATRSKYLKALEHNNIKIANAEKKNLKELKTLIDKHKINLSYRTRDWDKHEKDIVSGVNVLFKNGFFIKKGKKITDTKHYFAEQVGGGKLSDVKVTHEATIDKSFFIECKLNLQDAQYFKFGIRIVDDKLHYDHSKFLEGDIKNDKEQVKKIDLLFNKDINLDKFLNNIANSKEIRAYWKQFLNNLHDVNDFIRSNEEFKDFAKQSIGNDFPNGFKNMSQTFDKYCEYYIEKYNSLIDQLFDLITADELVKQKRRFKIAKRKTSDTIDDNVVFNTIDLLVATVRAEEDESDASIVKDNKKFDMIVNAIKKIEVKFMLLLKENNLNPNNFNGINQIKDFKKMMHFFKMFLSSTGKKSKGKIALLDNAVDEFGNMQLFPEVNIDSNLLAQMITDYYVKKDNCAYILIADTVMQFDKKINPLQLPKLPIFSEVMNKFSVKLLVNDNLTKISLSITAIEIDEKKLSKFNVVSFKKNDANWIMDELKNVKVN